MSFRAQSELAPSGAPYSNALATEHLRHDLKGRSVRGGAVTLTAQAIRYGLQVLSTVVLARLLTPRDYGLVAMVTAITGVVFLFADAGLSHATVQRQEIEHAQVNALFWVNAGLGVLLMLVTVALGPVLAWFYSEARLFKICAVLAVSFVFSGLGVQHGALLNRQMRYRAIAVRDIASASAGALTGIVMAWYGAGYWSLVAMVCVTSFIQMLISWVLVNWRPSLPRLAPGTRSLLTFGGNIIGSSFVSYLQRNMDNVLVGRYWGAAPLGLYSRAYSLLVLPLSQINAPIAAVAIPALSRLQDDPERQARYYLRASNLIMWLSAPLMGFLFVAAQPVILLVLGERWREAAPVFQLLAISALLQPLCNSTGWLFVSRGRADRLLKLSLINTPIIIASFLVGLPFGIRGVALSYSLAYLLVQPWSFKFTFSGTKITMRKFAMAIAIPISICMLAVVCGMVVARRVAADGNVERLVTIAVSYGAVYGVCLLLPRVREEVRSLARLVRELRGSPVRV